jgi:hypothetical protein
MICNKWYVFTIGEATYCDRYETAVGFAKKLEAAGYVDADRG